MVCDVSDADQIADLRDRALAAHGAVHLLCNNAGVASGRPNYKTKPAVWDWVVGVNLLGPAYGIEAFDSMSGEPVAAAVRELTPGAFDLSATLGTKDTARAVAKDAAAKLRARLDSLRQRPPTTSERPMRVPRPA